jgi:hypothetical protein
MRQPPGYVNNTCPEYVCRIQKNLYGLKQAPRVWHNTIDPFLKQIGFQSTVADPCLYYMWKDGNLVLLPLYVDDLAIASDSEALIKTVSQQLMKKFAMTLDGDLTFLLGMKIRRDRETKAIYLSSESKIEEILNDFNMASSIPATTPIDAVTVTKDDCPPTTSNEWSHMQDVPYRQCVGRLTHLSRSTRPDLSFAVSVVSRFLHNPGKRHWEVVKRILRYLKGTANLELKIAPQSTTLIGNSDADWAGNRDTFKSTSGYSFFIGGALISWASKAQPTVATSSTHAEYAALYQATTECLWLRNMLKDIKLLNSAHSTNIYCDNEAAIKIANYHMITPRSKHFDIKLHAIREQITNGTISLAFCPGKENVADFFTKPLHKQKFIQYRTELGLIQRLVHDTGKGQ